MFGISPGVVRMSVSMEITCPRRAVKQDPTFKGKKCFLAMLEMSESYMPVVIFFC